MSPQRALVDGCLAVAVIEAGLLAFGQDVSRAVPALLLLVPVVVAGVLGGRLVGLVVALVAAWVMRFYPLDDTTLAQVQGELQQRREAQA